LSHGNQETAYDLITEVVKKGIKVACFDTLLVDAKGQATSIPGVTQMFQNDQLMADMLLDYICNTLYPQKVARKEPVRILKLYIPGRPAQDRRQETYIKYEQQGLVKTLETLGPTDMQNPEPSVTQVTAAALPRYKQSDIDAVWCTYDALARGAYVALKEANMNVPLVTVDISNQDINYMLDGRNSWKACAAVDFTTVGEQGVRMLAMKLNGEETELLYYLTPSMVTADQLSSSSNVTNLKDTIPGYGRNDDHISPWMAPYLK
jgi:simple sugar transport system substrate-binding protein